MNTRAAPSLRPPSPLAHLHGHAVRVDHEHVPELRNQQRVDLARVALKINISAEMWIVDMEEARDDGIVPG